MISAIYETKGRAREYCELAMNLYSGCSHGCLYCYAPAALHVDQATFAQPHPRLSRKEISLSAYKVRLDRSIYPAVVPSPVLLCFTCDPYQPIDAEHQLTRRAIEALHMFGLPFTVLTKAGKLAQRDFDLYETRDSFGTTLTFMDETMSRQWEPGAATPDERMANLAAAHERGIPTWVSLEPVIEPAESLAVIYATHDFVDHYKVGKLNHRPEAGRIDWATFAGAAMAILRRYQKGFYIKKDLAAFIGQPEGIKEGRQLP